MLANIIRVAAVVAAGVLSAVTPTLSAEQARGVSVDDWPGWSVMTGGKGYASTPLGQVHYRDIGPRDDATPIVLLHQSPMSMIQFAEVQNAFADMGVRSIALDTPGYGLSDLPFNQPTIKDYADNIVPVLDHLGVDKVFVAGHHTGAMIGTSFAVHHADRTLAVILHGTPLFTADERLAYLNMDRTPRTPLPDGSHLSRGFRPQDPPLSQTLLDARTWGVLTAYIQGPDLGHWAAYHYDMLPDLKAIRVPGLFLSDRNDVVREMDLRALETRPDFQRIEFSDGGTLAFMAEPQRWAEIVAAYMASIAK